MRIDPDHGGGDSAPGATMARWSRRAILRGALAALAATEAAARSASTPGIVGDWAGDAWNDTRQTRIRVARDGVGALMVEIAYGEDARMGRLPADMHRVPATVRADGVVVDVSPRLRITLTHTPDDRVFARWERAAPWRDVRYALLRRAGPEPWPALGRDRPWRMLRIPVPRANGDDDELVATFYPAAGRAPAPLALLIHGDVTPGQEGAVIHHGAIARLLASRGWAVVEPMHRGAGGSRGRFFPEFPVDRSLDAAYGDAMAAAAFEEFDAVVDAARGWPGIDARRPLMVGQSRGGLFAILQAARRPADIAGVINFAGGAWCDADEPATSAGPYARARFAEAGALARAPTLWLYADTDLCVSPATSRAAFDAYRAAGGSGDLVMSSGLYPDGHGLILRPSYWEAPVLAFIGRLTR
ncbi:MAG: hypothetical protein IPK81_24095 [Rhodospirillales bacterium]|nr:MAG: hypothetical protein IPK81_24095 [Rhodospirillales bacterium]